MVKFKFVRIGTQSISDKLILSFFDIYMTVFLSLFRKPVKYFWVIKHSDFIITFVTKHTQKNCFKPKK